MSSVPSSKTVLLLAPYGRDAESLASIIGEKGYRSAIASSLDDLARRLDDSVGAVLLTEEAIAGNPAALVAALRNQESWSDIPFVLLRAPRSSGPGKRAALPDEALNVVELERPLSAASLVSAVTSALRARQKQFIIRDQMVRLEESQSLQAESEAELRLIADSIPVLIGFVDTNLIYRFANLAYEEWFGVPVNQILGRRMPDVLGPMTWAERSEAIDRALHGRPVRMEVSWPRRDGRRRDADIRYLPRFAADGQVDGFHIFATDVTVRKVALEATQQQAALLESRVAERTAELKAEMAARETSEEALRQAQKMEAVGQLTGGIAHDFNNMLTGILAAMELMRMRLDAKRYDNLDRFLDIASTSAQRAAGLTQRLLAFSRRQSLDPRPVDVEDMVRSMEDLLARTLGERVQLHTELGDVPRAMVDTNQLESALLNLAINARDAMPEGGSLCVRTTLEALPDAADKTMYVVMSVTDTGTGMDADTLDKIFEPFFTTKPIGQGTGLGMSMIYGFVRQSHGHVRITSGVGQGTTVRLYLPVATGSEPASEQVHTLVLQGGGQRILVVEDDVQVRTLVTELLGQLGYVVEAVESADAALPLLASGRALDLLVTDVGLPGLNGRQLAEIARQSRPELPVLFMTGYAATTATQGEYLDVGMTLITKPFTLSALSSAVSGILASTRPEVVARGT